jgi:hypothetical protein
MTTCRIVDPRVIALGRAMLAADIAMVELRDQLHALNLDADKITDPLRAGYHRSVQLIDKAISGH